MFCLGFVIAALLDSVPVWTLERCLERGLQEGIETRQQELLLRRQREAMRLSPLDYLPEVVLQTSLDFSWGRSVDMQELMIIDHRLNLSNSWSAGASLSSARILEAALETRGKRHRIREAESALEEMRTELMIAITEAYLGLLLAEKNYENARVGYTTILAQQERTEKEVSAGRLPYRSLAEIEARSASEKAAMAGANGQRRSAAMTLSRYLNLSPEEELAIAPPPDDSLPSPGGLPSREEMEHYLSLHPGVRRAEAALETARNLQWGNRLALLPEVTLSGGYGTYYSNTSRVTYRNQLSGNGNPSLGLSLSLPLPGAGKVSRIREGDGEVKRLTLEVEKVRQTLYSEMLNTLLEAINSYETCRAAEENMAALGEAFRANEIRFENGAITSTDYLVSRTNWQRAVGDYWQARYRYLFQMKIISLRKIPIQKGGPQ